MAQVQKKRLNVLSNAKKIALIEEKKNGVIKNKDLAKKYGNSIGIKESTVSKLWKNRSKYDSLSKIDKKSKKIVTLKFQNIENAVIYAFNQWREHNVPVTGLMLQSKAKKFAEIMNIPDFKGKQLIS